MDKKVVLSFLVGMLAAVSVSVAAVLLFSLVLTFTDIPSVVVTLINYVIRLASLFIGVFMFVSGGKGAIKGAVFGLVYALITSFIFALIAGGLDFDLKFFADILYCIVVGTVLGILAVNVKKN